MTESITCNHVVGVLIVVFTVLTGCGTIAEREIQTEESGRQPAFEFENSFSVAPQSTPPPEIQSLQLYGEGSPSTPPVIRLGSEEQLTLEFDHMGSGTHQFRVTVRHYTANWENSNLNPDLYLDGFYEDYFTGGEVSSSQRPSYRHYEYRLPNSRFSLTASGNYLLVLHDAYTGRKLFSLPFFVSEDEGALQTRVEKIYARRQDLREQDQLFSEYRYPPFVEIPRFDLKFVYVQNRFWGRARFEPVFDTSTPGTVHFHLTRENSFTGDYEFRTLDLRSFTPTGESILSYQPEYTPPRIILRRDVQHLSPVPAFSPGTGFGLPTDDRNAGYAQVFFHLEAAEPADTLGDVVYLVGDFNGWTVREQNRMKFDATTGLWEGRALIKQGEYAYKYVVLEGDRINDLRLDRSFTFRNQEYLTMVYFRDPSRHFDRLLKVDVINN